MHKAYCVVTGTLFVVVALAHLARLVFGWAIHVDTQVVPMWVSILGFVIPGGLSVWAFRLSTRSSDDA